MPPEKPSELELQILGILWRNGPLTVRETLNRTLDGKKRAYTTILSVMQVMEKKGLLSRTREGLTDRWKPLVRESQILRPLMRDLVRKIFGGSPASAMQCLLGGARMDRGQIGELRALLDSYEAGQTTANPHSKPLPKAGKKPRRPGDSR